MSDRSARVVVAMSGGVDSSVAAALLVDQGYQVIGMMMRLWSESGHLNDNRCCTPEAMNLARKVAASLSIPFYAIDAQSAHYEIVVRPFIEDYTHGITPNPCLACNRQVRWGFLLDRARALGASHMATGHYARISRQTDGRFQLLKAGDIEKDQSYVLHVLNQDQLSQALFPLGELTKHEVRRTASQLGLPVADRKDSQDLCFLAGEDYRHFLARNAPQTLKPGPILNTDGEQIGEHQGLAYYTIGQRKGLGLVSSTPLYVVTKDVRRNSLTVGSETALGTNRFKAGPINWISGATPERPFRAQVKIRYKANPEWAKINPLSNNQVLVEFEQNIRDITPGQAAVFYSNELCLGGGLILAENPE